MTMRRLTVAVLALLLSGCAAKLDRRDVPDQAMAATAHPLATEVALDMLDRGGTPIDAAIAAQMVLGLVEAQSSGIGGGSLLMVWDEKSRKLTTFDGLAAAPAKATAGLRMDASGRLLESAEVQRGGRSVGVPGTLAMLEKAHARFGKLPWASLFEPAIRLATRGFPMAKYMHGILNTPTAADEHPDLVPVFFGPDRKVLPVGTIVRNPDYAAAMRRIADGGPVGASSGEGAAKLLETLQRGTHASYITLQDLRDYVAQEYEPLCASFITVYTVCVMGPPSYGGIAVLQVLQTVEAAAAHSPGRAFNFDDPEFVHLYAEAGKLAQADRRQYVGDPQFVTVPSRQLVDAVYTRKRAVLIDATRAATEPAAGVVDRRTAAWTPDGSDPVTATSQLAIADRNGNALSMTTTINLNFGSRLMAGGVMLNNALTNFAAVPRAGQVVANAMAPGKRPVTSMAPTMVFGKHGEPVVVGGSAGGGQIVDYIAQSLIEMLVLGRSPAEALARGHVSTAIAGKLQLEKGTAAEALAPALTAKGHSVDIVPMTSGLAFIARRGPRWIGAADPRRDGAAQ